MVNIVYIYICNIYGKYYFVYYLRLVCFNISFYLCDVMSERLIIYLKIKCIL